MNKPTKPSPLGRGLSALFNDSDTGYQPRGASVVSLADKKEKGSITQIPVAWLQPGAYQPRRNFDETALQELAESVRERGVLQPLLVRSLEAANSYEIVAGERRWRAAQMAGLHDVPVIVRAMTDREAMEIGIIENVQREGLSPVDEADGYRRLLDEFGHTHEELSRIIGKSRSYISNVIRILTLPDSVKMMLDDGLISAGHGRAIVCMKDPVAAAKEIVKKGLSVRQAEALARREAEERPERIARAKAVNADALALERDLSRILGLKVQLDAKERKGSITIHYQNLDQLDDLVKKLTRE